MKRSLALSLPHLAAGLTLLGSSVWLGVALDNGVAATYALITAALVLTRATEQDPNGFDLPVRAPAPVPIPVPSRLPRDGRRRP